MTMCYYFAWLNTHSRTTPGKKQTPRILPVIVLRLSPLFNRLLHLPCLLADEAKLHLGRRARLRWVPLEARPLEVLYSINLPICRTYLGKLLRNGITKCRHATFAL